MTKTIEELLDDLDATWESEITNVVVVEKLVAIVIRLTMNGKGLLENFRISRCGAGMSDDYSIACDMALRAALREFPGGRRLLSRNGLTEDVIVHKM